MDIFTRKSGTIFPTQYLTRIDSILVENLYPLGELAQSWPLTIFWSHYFFHSRTQVAFGAAVRGRGRAKVLKIIATIF